VAQLYPEAPSTHFSRLLLHARATVGLFFSQVTTQGVNIIMGLKGLGFEGVNWIHLV
jgi:hypothetical protein